MTEKRGDLFGRAFRLKAVDDLRQRDVVAWNRAYLGYPHKTALADERQACLQAAIEAEWILEPVTSYEDVTDPKTGKTARRHYFDGVQVDDMRANEVSHYGRLCNDLFNAAMSPPKA